VLALIALVAVSIGMFMVWKSMRPVADDTLKTVQIVIYDGTHPEYRQSIETRAATLREVLEQADLIEGEETAVGLFVTKVNGVLAQTDLQQWWRFSQSGEVLMTGVSDTPVEEGVVYEITLVTGW